MKYGSQPIWNEAIVFDIRDPYQNVIIQMINQRQEIILEQNLDLNDELARSKRMLDEKYFEAGRLREEAVAKGDQNND